jgi:hypothetical protein
MGTFFGGLGAQMMLAAETTYATIVAPNRSFEFSEGETMALERVLLPSKQLAAGRQTQSSARTIATTRAAAGALSLEVPNQGFGPIINLFHGETVTPAKEAATSIYKQVHNIGTTDPSKKSVTLQLGKPTIEGAVQAYTYPGTTGVSLGLSIQPAAYLMAALTFDSNDEQTATALGTFSPPTLLQSFPFTKASVKINGVEQTLADAMSVNISTPKNTARYYAGAEKKALPLTNAYGVYTGSITVDYKDQTLYKLFEEAKTIPIEITFTGETVEGIVTELKIKMEACKLTGDSPNVANAGALQQVIPFQAEDDRVHPPVVITYVSKDSAL